VILDRLAADLGRPRTPLTDSAAEALRSHDWPGNIRELRNVLERALLHARDGAIDAGLLHLDRAPKETSTAVEFPFDLPLRELERRHIERALNHHGGHVERAAVMLGMSRSTLYEKIKRYQLGPAKPA